MAEVDFILIKIKLKNFFQNFKGIAVQFINQTSPFYIILPNITLMGYTT
jgi:hypothetical protein